MSQSIRNNTLEFSLAGGVVIDDTAAYTGEWGAIQVINTAVIASITMPNLTNSSGLATLTLNPGVVIYGDVSAITLTSGVVIAHAV